MAGYCQDIAKEGLTMHNILVTRAKYRVRATEDVVEDWMVQHKEAMKVLDYEMVCADCMDLAKFLCQIVSKMVREVFANEAGAATYEERVWFAEIVMRGIQIYEKVIADGTIFAKDYEIAGFAEALETLDTLKAGLQKLQKTCPEPDWDLVRESGEAIQCGDCLSAEEALANA